jgi:hypothetical protein
MNLKRTSTLSSVASSSSSDAPLFPARSSASMYFAISSAGRFCRTLIRCSNASFRELPNASFPEKLHQEKKRAAVNHERDCM